MKKEYLEPIFEEIKLDTADFLLASQEITDGEFGNGTEGSIGGDEIGGIF